MMGLIWGRIPNALWVLLIGLGQIQSTEGGHRSERGRGEREGLPSMVGVPVGMRDSRQLTHVCQDTMFFGII